MEGGEEEEREMEACKRYEAKCDGRRRVREKEKKEKDNEKGNENMREEGMLGGYMEL